MKNLMQLSLAVVCCLVLMGCPYESQVPISKPTIPVDSRLLGSWSSNDEVYNSYIVTRASEAEYHILQHNIAGTSRFRGHLTEVKNAIFMNLYSDSTKNYYLYRVSLTPDGDRLTLLPVSKDLPHHFGSMDGLRNYIEKNYSFQSFYNEADKAEYIKAKGHAASAVRN
jgi:hypothetical protein